MYKTTKTKKDQKMSAPSFTTLSANITSLFAPETWNKKRSSDELRSFVSTRLANCDEELGFSL